MADKELVGVLLSIAAGIIVLALGIFWGMGFLSKSGDAAQILGECKLSCVGPDPVQLILVGGRSAFIAESPDGEVAPDPFLGTNGLNEANFIICNCRGKKISSLQNAYVKFTVTFRCSQEKYGDGEWTATYTLPDAVKQVRNLEAGKGTGDGLLTYGKFVTRVGNSPTSVASEEAKDYRLEMLLPRNDFTGAWKAELFIDNSLLGSTGGAIGFNNKAAPADTCTMGLPAT
ncbi:MAG: hypothetical protein V1820_01215 [archaeon]